MTSILLLETYDPHKVIASRNIYRARQCDQSRF